MDPHCIWNELQLCQLPSSADLMRPEPEHVQQARRLIADLEAPRPPVLPTQAAQQPSGLSTLNEDQQAAVHR